MAKKITKAQMFEQILSHTADEAEKAFLENEIELLAKKKATAKKPTKEQEATAALKNAIVAFLTELGAGMTVSEMIKDIPECADLSNQKVTSAVTALKADGVLVKTMEKGKAYFTVA